MLLLKSSSSRVSGPVLREFNWYKQSRIVPFRRRHWQLRIASESHSSSGRFIPLPPVVPCFIHRRCSLSSSFSESWFLFYLPNFFFLSFAHFCLILFFRLSLICLTLRKLFVFVFLFFLRRPLLLSLSSLFKKKGWRSNATASIYVNLEEYHSNLKLNYNRARKQAENNKRNYSKSSLRICWMGRGATPFHIYCYFIISICEI